MTTTVMTAPGVSKGSIERVAQQTPHGEGVCRVLLFRNRLLIKLHRDAGICTTLQLVCGLPFRLKRGATDEMLSESFALLRQIALSTRGDHGRKNVI